MMNEYSVKHDTFTLERRYNASPARTFAAWADPAIKANWFPQAEKFEFRIGGQEIVSGSEPGGPVYRSVATYHDIVPEHRIAYSITIDMGDRRISISVVTVEFKANGKATQLSYTEQCAFFDGLDSTEMHKLGAADFLDQLASELGGADEAEGEGGSQ